MRRGQLSLEAVVVVGLVIVIFAGVVWSGLMLSQEASDMNDYAFHDLSCNGLSSVIESVYSGGSGSVVSYDVSENFTVCPGSVMTKRGGNTF